MIFNFKRLFKILIIQEISHFVRNDCGGMGEGMEGCLVAAKPPPNSPFLFIDYEVISNEVRNPKGFDEVNF